MTDTVDDGYIPDFVNIQRDVAKQGMSVELRDGIYHFYPVPDKHLPFKDLDKFYLFYIGFINGWIYGNAANKINA